MFDRLRTKWRRFRLERAYSKMVKRREGFGAGFSVIMATWDEMENDGVLTIKDGEKRWHWPENSTQTPNHDQTGDRQ